MGPGRAEGGVSPSGLVVSRLVIYPVKGCGGVSVGVMELDAVGPVLDRRWLIVDPEGVFRSQRGDPGMVRISPRLTGEGLELTTPGLPSLLLPLGSSAGDGDAATAGEVMQVEVWGERVPASVVSPEADRWVSRALGAPSHLVRMRPSDGVRTAPSAFVPGARVGFADAFPLLVVGEASLRHLNGRLTRPVEMDRFRPNVVVEGSPPHDEDRWRRVRVGGGTLRIVKPCARCSVPGLDPRTGEPGKEPLRTLAGYRRWEGKIWFGQNAVHEGPCRLSVGDPVEVLETGESRPGLELAEVGLQGE